MPPRNNRGALVGAMDAFLRPLRPLRPRVVAEEEPPAVEAEEPPAVEAEKRRRGSAPAQLDLFGVPVARGVLEAQFELLRLEGERTLNDALDSGEVRGPEEQPQEPEKPFEEEQPQEEEAAEKPAAVRPGLPASSSAEALPAGAVHEAAPLASGEVRGPEEQPQEEEAAPAVPAEKEEKPAVPAEKEEVAPPADDWERGRPPRNPSLLSLFGLCIGFHRLFR